MNFKTIIIICAILTGSFLTNAQQSIKSLGALEFNPEGVLFVGDNLSGAIHAIDLTTESRTKKQFEINVYNVDVQVAAVLGSATQSIQINDLAVHPKSGETFLSVTRGHGVEAMPVLIKIRCGQQVD